MLSLHAGLWLAQGAATLPDTIIAKQVVATSGITTLTTILNGIVSLVLVVLLVVLIPIALGARRMIKRAEALMDRLTHDVGPIVTRVTAVSEHLDYISKTLRGNVEDISRTIRRATDSVNDGIEGAERRLAELGALAHLAQTELEDAVVSTAATMRGLRAGADVLRGLVPDHHDSASDDWPDAEEELDDDEDEAPPRARRARGPRIRSRSPKGERG